MQFFNNSIRTVHTFCFLNAKGGKLLLLCSLQYGQNMFRHFIIYIYIIYIYIYIHYMYIYVRFLSLRSSVIHGFVTEP